MITKFLKAAVASALSLSLLAAAPAMALDTLKILVPANPGGGWDQTGRALQAALQSGGIVKTVTVDNKGAPAAPSAWPSSSITARATATPCWWAGWSWWAPSPPTSRRSTSAR